MVLAVAAGLILAVNTGLTGCASGPGTNQNGILRFTVKISDAGQIDTLSNGFYAILLNSFSEPIDVTNYETFTDFIRFDGVNFRWFHRQGNVPSPGYTWVDGGSMNTDAAITDDGKSIIISVDLGDRRIFSTNTFKAIHFRHIS